MTHTSPSLHPAAAATSRTEEGRAAHAATSHAAARLPLPHGTTVCERRGGVGFDDDEHGPQRSPGLPNNKARDDTACTRAEVRLCQRAAAHGYGLSGALDAELCLLRRPRAGPASAASILPLLVGS